MYSPPMCRSISLISRLNDSSAHALIRLLANDPSAISGLYTSMESRRSLYWVSSTWYAIPTMMCWGRGSAWLASMYAILGPMFRSAAPMSSDGVTFHKKPTSAAKLLPTPFPRSCPAPTSARLLRMNFRPIPADICSPISAPYAADRATS